MATTTVTVLTSTGGYATVINGSLTGDSTRDVTVSAATNGPAYEFVGWEITLEAPSGTGTTGDGGTGGGTGGGGGGSDVNLI